jgi:GMP synthase (glutamine-hydrolysing)
MKPILIIKAGNKISSLSDTAGDFEHWIMQGSGHDPAGFESVAVYDDQTLPAPGKVGAVIITGSAAMVTDESSWIVATRHWLRTAITSGLPVLGICFGHQLVASALGAEVGDNPNGIEVGTRPLTLTKQAGQDRLFAGLSSMPVQTSHRQSVLRAPAHSTLLATTAMDPYSALRFTDNCWGVQFHPEFDQAITRHFVEHYRESLQQQGQDPDRLLQQVDETPVAASLLQRFVQLATNEQ